MFGRLPAFPISTDIEKRAAQILPISATRMKTSFDYKEVGIQV